MIVEQTDQTSSIGAVWPPQPFSNERLRGFYTEHVIRTEADAEQFAAIFAEHRQRLDTSNNLTRLSIRAIVQAGQLATLHALGVPVEGALPLANTEPGLCVAYTAVNHNERRASEAELHGYQQLLHNALERPRHTGDAEATLESRGMEARAVDHSRAELLVDDFLPLYSAFGYDRHDVLELLRNPRNRIVYIVAADQVVSTAMAELHRLPIHGLGTLTIGEITEAYTLPSHRQQGLYRCASQLLVAHVIEEFGPGLNCLYGESNLAQPGVVFAAHENGRNFSHFDQPASTIPNFGILQRNVAISDGPEAAGYNDFALSYIPL